MQILVLGMHRSGTSTVSRILNLMGIYFGSEGISTGANEENKKGFWERKDVRQLNDFILQSNDFDWYKISNFDSTKNFSTETVNEFNKRAKNIILDMDAFRPWFIKEPRLCLNLGLWEKQLEVPVCIYVYRNPIEVAKSLQVRNGFPIEYGLALWEKYNYLALKQSESIPTYFLDYNKLIQNPIATSSELMNFLKHENIPIRESSEKEILAFIDPSLYRQRVVNKSDKFLTTSQAKLYKILSDVNSRSVISIKSIKSNEILLAKYEKIFKRGFSYDIVNAEKVQLEKEYANMSSKVTILNEQIDKFKSKALDLEKNALQRNETIKKRDEQLKNIENRVREVQFAIINKEEELRSKEERIREKNDEIRNQTVLLSTKDLELKNKEEIIREKEDKISNQTVLLSTKDLELKNKEEIIREKEDKISNQTVLLSTKDLELKNKEEIIREKEDKISNQTVLLSTKDLELKNKEEIIREKEDKISNQTVLLSTKDLELKNKEEIIREKEDKISNQTVLLSTKDLELKNKEEIISEKEEEISNQIAALSSKNIEFEHQEEIYVELNKNFTSIKYELKIKEEEYAKLKYEFLDKNNNLSAVKKQLGDFAKFQQELIKSNKDLEINIDILSKELIGSKSRINRKNQIINEYWNQIQKSRISNRVRSFIGLKYIDTVGSPEKEELELPPNLKMVLKFDISKIENYPKVDFEDITECAYRDFLPNIELDGTQQEQKIKTTTIIIPVYNAYDDVIKCIVSVIDTVGDREIIVIDDASPDDRIIPMLKKYESEFKNFKIILNKTNLGYTRSINKAIISSGDNSDIVLVNSDTIVTEFWIDLLEESAYIDKSIGSVTAISNNAGAFSVPKINSENNIPSNLTLNDYARIVRSLNDGKLTQVPTGSGFIFYVKRKIFQNIGLFDEFNFPRGYGEENDFCQRIIANGYVNIIDARVYIYHKRSASFKEEKNVLIGKAKAKLARIHPTYKSQINEFINNHPLQVLSDKLNKANLLKMEEEIILNDSQVNILFIIHDGGGGSIHTNKDLVDGLKGDYKRFILLCGVSKWKLYDAQQDNIIKEFDFEKRWLATEPCGHERLIILGLICKDLNIQITHFRSIIAIGPEALQHAKNLGMRVIFSLHDFIIICPTIQLIDNNDIYCAGTCTKGEGKCKISTGWFGDIPNLKHEYIYVWRKKINRYLPFVDEFITTSNYSKSLFMQHFSIIEDSKFSMIEHGRDLHVKSDIAVLPNGKIVKIAIFGAMNVSKGTRLLNEIFKINSNAISSNAKVYFEFHIFGNTDREFSETREVPGVFHHGAYKRDELYELVKNIRPSYAMITSIWPETYCHTLTESWLMGLPVFASDIGTIKERVEMHGGAWLMDYSSAENWYNKMLEINTDKKEYSKMKRIISDIHIKEKSKMIGDYKRIYERLLNNSDHE